MNKYLISVLVAAFLICSIPSFSDEKAAAWEELAHTIPFRNVWNAPMRDPEGKHIIVNVWVEKGFKTEARELSELEKETVGEEAAKIIEKRVRKQKIEKLIFIETLDKRLYAVEVESGVVKWATLLPNEIQYRPYFGARNIYLTSDEVLFAIERAYGLIAWRKGLDFPVSTSPVMGVAGIMYMSSWENRIFAINSRDKTSLWQFRTDGNITAKPLYKEGVIYVPSENGIMYCVKNTGELSYKFETSGALRTSPSATEGFLIFGSNDYSLYCINRYSGVKIWEARIGSDILRKPVIQGKMVFVKPRGKGMTGISVETGREIWEIPYTSKIVGFNNKIIYLYTGDHDKERLILGVEKETGDILSAWDPTDSIESDFDEPLRNIEEVSKIFFVNKNPGEIFMCSEKGYYEKIHEKRSEELAEEEEAQAEEEAEAEDEEEGLDELDLLEIEGPE